jgi:hypothetical protein
VIIEEVDLEVIFESDTGVLRDKDTGEVIFGEVSKEFVYFIGGYIFIVGFIFEEEGCMVIRGGNNEVTGVRELRGALDVKIGEFE